MTESSDDLALETLLAVRAEIAPDLDEQLLRSCYALQKKHQFDRDRSPSSQAMDRLIEERVNAILDEGRDGAGQ
ncbi:MAG: DNA modification system-associated small protein [Isosphaeraceae bacterium]